MQKPIEITLDNISKIGSKINDPKLLICSLCLCISPNLKQCKNSKCLKLFCDNCYFKSKIIELKCPFCRMTMDYCKLDSEICTIIDNLKFFCDKSMNCNCHYSFVDYSTYHINHKKEKELKCTVCLFDISNTPNKATCIICLKKGCSMLLDSIPICLGKVKNQIAFCLKKCFICKESICVKCIGRTNKKYGENLICEYCNSNCFFCYSNIDANYICDCCQRILCSKCKADCETCEYVFCKDRKCYKEKLESCTECSKIKTNYYTCLHTNLFKCGKCYPSCSKCYKRKGIIECNSCSNLLCGVNCGIKCKECKAINCSSCMKMCSICKIVLCSNCSTQCSNCFSLVTCKVCNSDTIIKCRFPECLKYLCINCWNVCNYCNTIFCDDHSITCINCEDKMCNLHYHKCSACSKMNDDNYKKLCLKKCTLKCSFCSNISNSYCNPLNHQTTLVNNYNCEHNVCLSCVKKCIKCDKIVVQCPKCIVDYYFINCKYCSQYLCITCSKNCIKCEDNYCSLTHVCYCCNKVDMSASCINCVYAKRIKCQRCNKSLHQCDICSKRYICSFECYVNYMRNNNNGLSDHMCQSFECLLHSKEYDNNILFIC